MATLWEGVKGVALVVVALSIGYIATNAIQEGEAAGRILEWVVSIWGALGALFAIVLLVAMVS